jgi:hypothetical protein
MRPQPSSTESRRPKPCCSYCGMLRNSIRKIERYVRAEAVVGSVERHSLCGHVISYRTLTAELEGIMQSVRTKAQAGVPAWHFALDLMVGDRIVVHEPKTQHAEIVAIEHVGPGARALKNGWLRITVQADDGSEYVFSVGGWQSVLFAAQDKRV